MPGPSAMRFHFHTSDFSALHHVHFPKVSEQLILGPNVCSTHSSSSLGGIESHYTVTSIFLFFVQIEANLWVLQTH